MGDTPTRPRGLIWPAFVTIFEAAWSIPGNLNNVVPTLGDKVLLKVGPKGTFREKTVFGKVTEVIGQTCLVKLSDSTKEEEFYRKMTDLTVVSQRRRLSANMLRLLSG